MSEGLLRDVCARIEITAETVMTYENGVNFCALVNSDTVIKIFQPELPHQWESDTRVLRHLQGRLSLPIPRFIDAGKLSNGQSYLVMSKVEGQLLIDVWSELSRPEKIQILSEIGRVMKEVHRIPIGELTTLPPEWNSFLQIQRARCLTRHQKQRMPEWFTTSLEAWLDSIPDKLSREHVILTGEYTPFNMLVSKTSHGYQLSGMIDFGDAMIGPREYDLLGPSLFLTAGDSELLQSLLEGYGWGDLDTDQLLKLQVLHRYSNFKAQLAVKNWQEKAHDFRGLADLIWPGQTLTSSIPSARR